MDRLSEIRARCDAATDGPWEASKSSWGVIMLFDRERHPLMATPKGADNAAFIAHARADIPYLLAEVKRLHGKLQDQEYQISLDSMEQSRDEAIARAEKVEAENRWIPVSERLPEESEYRNKDRYKSMDSNDLVPFLACCKDTEIPFRAFYDGKNWGDGWNKMDVICWMPLPEPPKGAQDE